MRRVEVEERWRMGTMDTGNVDVDISEHGWKEENAGEGRGRNR